MEQVERPETCFELVLTKNQFAALERLRQLCGHNTVSETLAKALGLYLGGGTTVEATEKNREEE